MNRDASHQEAGEMRFDDLDLLLTHAFANPAILTPRLARTIECVLISDGKKPVRRRKTIRVLQKQPILSTGP